MSTLRLRNTVFKYVEQGSGESIILVHGSASDYRTWQNQLEIFSRHYRVVAYSRRFHWPNELIADGEDYAMLQHVDDLRRLLDEIGSPPVHLIGHSYGAFLCLLLAMREPSLVRSLVLAEPPVLTLFTSPQPKPGEILRLLFSRPRTALAIAKFGAGGVAPAAKAARHDDIEKALKHFGIATLGRAAFNKLSDSRRDIARANFIKMELLGSGFVPIDQDKVRALDIPVLLTTAQYSPSFFHHLANRLEELLPHVERAFIPDASHIMHEDNPTAFNEAVLSFLKKHNSSK